MSAGAGVDVGKLVGMLGHRHAQSVETGTVMDRVTATRVNVLVRLFMLFSTAAVVVVALIFGCSR